MSSSLPVWLERLLGLPTGEGEGTAWSLANGWDWRPSITLGFAVIAVILVVASYLRENRHASLTYRMILAAMRLATIGIVTLMVAQFVLLLQRTGLPYVAIVVDDSLSMTTADHYEQKQAASLSERVREAGFDKLTRWNLARTLLSERAGSMLREIQDSYRLRLYYLTGPLPSEQVEAEKILGEIRAKEPKGESTRLGSSMRAVLDDLRGSPPAAIILLSDGINTEGPDLAEAARYAARRGVPLYTVGIGDDRPIRDVRLSDLLVDETVFVDDIVYFEAKLTAVGYEGREVQVVLREQGKQDVLARQTVKLGPDGQSQPVRIPYRPTKEGDFRYVVEAEPLEGELQIENNRQERTVRVRKEKIRVLLVWAEPSFEFRYLENMFQRAAAVELKTLLQNGDLEHAEQNVSALKGFPVRRDDLFQYDVIVLGDVNPAGLTAANMQHLAEFVDQPGKGGTLICVAGPNYMPLAFRQTPLARLMPFDLGTARVPDPNQPILDGFTVQPTDLGLATPGMQLGDTPADTPTVWKSLPPLYWMLEAPDLKPGVRVLAEHPSRTGRQGRPLPLILLRYAGAGRVLFHTMDETWRWRWRVGDVYFARYWIQMIRYLARSKLNEGDRTTSLSTDRRQYDRGEPVRIRVRFADDRLAPDEDEGVTVVLENQGQKTQRINLRRSAGSRGVFEATMNNPALGAYHAWVAVPATKGRAAAIDFLVIQRGGELDRLDMDSRQLEQAAELTKGHYYTFSTAGSLVEELPEGRQVPVETLPPKPLWNTWPVLVALLSLLIGEWILRKMGGMV